ncbi:MAG: cellulase family glycosylhydrolase, partial [Anaerolineae bacterium]
TGSGGTRPAQPSTAYPAPGRHRVAGRRLLLPVITGGRAGITGGGPMSPTAARSTDGGPSSCPGIAVADGVDLTVDGTPLFFFGINAPFLLDNEFPEERALALVAEVAARGVNTVRVWFFHDEDPQRLARLLEAGRNHGVRFVVTLADNVFKGPEWFFGSDDEEEYRPHLRTTVSRFRDSPQVLLWEVMNEPNCGEAGVSAACLKTMRDWLTMATRMVRAIDECHVVSTGMIGAGNRDDEAENFRRIHRKDAVGIVSVHRPAGQQSADAVEFAADIRKPIFFGEVYDKAFDAGCQPLPGKDGPRGRSETIKRDLRWAMDNGVDGYILWDLAAGAVTRKNGDVKYYCGPFGYALDDAVWDKLEAAGLPPPAPWTLGPAGSQGAPDQD